MTMSVDDPSSIEELARSLEEPLLPQQPLAQDDRGAAENDDTARSASGTDDSEGGNAETSSLYDGLPLKESLLVKSLYFLDALGSSAWGRFSAIYYNNHGLNT